MVQIKLIIFLIVSGLLMPCTLISQDSISKPAEEINYIDQTFFSTRIAQMQSTETLEKGVMDVRLAHRMGRINNGISELFGLSHAFSQFGIEYGLTDRLMFGLNTNTIDKIYLGFFKYKILRQSTGRILMPISLTWYSNTEINTAKLNFPNNQYYFSSRLFYTHQLILARKFSEKFSFQMAPVLVHKNMVKSREDKNNIILTSIAARYKIKRKVALTAEYNYLLPGQIYSEINGILPTNSLSLGVDIFTGKHTFQFFITNAVAMNEKSFLTETTEGFFKNEIHFGFNISRLFNIVNYYE